MKNNLLAMASGLLSVLALVPAVVVAQPGNGGGQVSGSIVVSSPQNVVTGNYTNITVQSGGRATLVGPSTVSGVLTVQAGGVLITNCQALTGAGSFVLQAGGELQICDAAGIGLSGATGAIGLSGSRSYAPGADYTYNGTVAQVTGSGLPATVRALSVSGQVGGGAGSLTLSQGVGVRQALRLTSGNLATNGQALTLLSDASGTALVDNTGGTVSGAASVQRFITPFGGYAGPGYHHYSAPVSGATVASLNTGTYAPTPNSAYNAAATPGSVVPFPTIFGYDQGRVPTAGSADADFVRGYFSPGATLLPMQGYSINVPATELLTFTGPLLSGNQSSGPLARGSGPQAGWHLLGNPYPAPLDWSLVTAQGGLSGVDAALYVYQSTGQYAGQYRSYVAGLGNPLIASGQAFFVRASTAGVAGAVSLANAQRVTTFAAGPAFNRPAAAPRPLVELTLADGRTADAATVYCQAGSTAGFDGAFDARKLANAGTVSLALLLPSGEPLAISGVPALAPGATVLPLAVAVPAAGPCTLAATALAQVPATTAVYLLDAATGTRTDLRQHPTYAFAATANMAGRFSLRFENAARPTGIRTGLSASDISLYPNPGTAAAAVRVAVPGQRLLAVQVLNALGQPVAGAALAEAVGSALLPTAGLPAGLYLVRVATPAGTATRRLLVQ